jgi:hypothetical protein
MPINEYTGKILLGVTVAQSKEPYAMHWRLLEPAQFGNFAVCYSVCYQVILLQVLIKFYRYFTSRVLVPVCYRKGNTARSFLLEVEYFVISVAQLVNTKNW